MAAQTNGGGIRRPSGSGRPKGGYTLADGTKIPGVTTICGLLDKPALVGWAGKLCAEAGHAAGRAGEPVPAWRDVCYGVRDKAAEAGTQAHTLFGAYLNGEPVPIPPDGYGWLPGALQAYDNAITWLQGTGLRLEVYSHERPLISEVHRFAGTPDAIAKDTNGVVHLADWKTGGIYAEHIIQMGAYRALLADVEGIRVSGVHLVRFSREHGDFAHHHFASDALDQGWEIFRRLLAIYEPLAELKRRCR